MAQIPCQRVQSLPGKKARCSLPKLFFRTFYVHQNEHAYRNDIKIWRSFPAIIRPIPCAIPAATFLTEDVLMELHTNTSSSLVQPLSSCPDFVNNEGSLRGWNPLVLHLWKHTEAWFRKPVIIHKWLCLNSDISKKASVLCKYSAGINQYMFSRLCVSWFLQITRHSVLMQAEKSYCWLWESNTATALQRQN